MSEKVITAIKEIANKNNIKLNFDQQDKELKSLGIDSLKMMDLVFKIEEKLNVMIPDEKLITIKTLKDLITILDSLVK